MTQTFLSRDPRSSRGDPSHNQQQSQNASRGARFSGAAVNGSSSCATTSSSSGCCCPSSRAGVVSSSSVNSSQQQHVGACQHHHGLSYSDSKREGVASSSSPSPGEHVYESEVFCGSGRTNNKKCEFSYRAPSADSQQSSCTDVGDMSEECKVAEAFLYDYFQRLNNNPRDLASLYMEDAEINWTGRQPQVNVITRSGYDKILSYLTGPTASLFKGSRTVVEALHPQPSAMIPMGVVLLSKGRMWLPIDPEGRRVIVPSSSSSSSIPSTTTTINGESSSNAGGRSSSSVVDSLHPYMFYHFVTLSPSRKVRIGSKGETNTYKIANEFLHFPSLNIMLPEEQQSETTTTGVDSSSSIPLPSSVGVGAVSQCCSSTQTNIHNNPSQQSNSTATQPPPPPLQTHPSSIRQRRQQHPQPPPPLQNSVSVDRQAPSMMMMINESSRRTTDTTTQYPSTEQRKQRRYNHQQQQQQLPNNRSILSSSSSSIDDPTTLFVNKFADTEKLHQVLEQTLKTLQLSNTTNSQLPFHVRTDKQGIHSFVQFADANTVAKLIAHGIVIDGVHLNLSTARRNRNPYYLSKYQSNNNRSRPVSNEQTHDNKSTDNNTKRPNTHQSPNSSSNPDQQQQHQNASNQQQQQHQTYSHNNKNHQSRNNKYQGRGNNNNYSGGGRRAALNQRAATTNTTVALNKESSSSANVNASESTQHNTISLVLT